MAVLLEAKQGLSAMKMRMKCDFNALRRNLNLGEMAMLKRIGQVIGWAGNIVAAVWLYATFPEWSQGIDFTGPLVAAVIFLIGQALRYVFAGSDNSVVS